MGVGVMGNPYLVREKVHSIPIGWRVFAGCFGGAVVHTAWRSAAAGCSAAADVMPQYAHCRSVSLWLLSLAVVGGCQVE